MRLIFFIFSIAYIVAIFLFADSPVVSDLAPLNPHSLLHIPLYGILTMLLIFCFVPIKLNRVNASTHQRFNVPNDPNVLNVPHVRFLIPVVISLIVAIADEIHQFFIPTRNASITDVFLDAIGIALAFFIISKFYRKKKVISSITSN